MVVLTIRMLTILFSKAPRVVVSHEGISVNSLLFRFTLIPWTDIAALVVDGPRMLKRDHAPHRASQSPRAPGSAEPVRDVAVAAGRIRAGLATIRTGI